MLAKTTSPTSNIKVMDYGEVKEFTERLGISTSARNLSLPN
jgi:hypothetical protein